MRSALAFVLCLLAGLASAQPTETFNTYINNLPTAVAPGASDQFYIRQGALSKQLPFSSFQLPATQLSSPVTNSNLATMSPWSIKCNPTGATGAAQDCTTGVTLVTSATATPAMLFGLSVGGAIPSATIPLEVPTTNQVLSVAGNYADSTSSTAGIYQVSSWLTQSGTRPAIALLGQAQQTGTGTSWAFNSVAYASAAAAVAISAELDIATTVSGATGYNLLLATSNSVANPGPFIQMQSNNANLNTNGIVFNKTGSFNPVSNALIVTTNNPSVVDGINFTSATFSGHPFSSNAFSVDANGNVTANLYVGGLVIGGVAANSTLTLRSANAASTTDTIIFQVGNAGATEAARILDSGIWKFGSPSFTANGAGAAVTFGATTPSAITTPATVFKWLTLQDNSGNTFYVPTWH